MIIPLEPVLYRSKTEIYFYVFDHIARCISDKVIFRSVKVHLERISSVYAPFPLARNYEFMLYNEIQGLCKY